MAAGEGQRPELARQGLVAAGLVAEGSSLRLELDARRQAAYEPLRGNSSQRTRLASAARVSPSSSGGLSSKAPRWPMNAVM